MSLVRQLPILTLLIALPVNATAANSERDWDGSAISVRADFGPTFPEIQDHVFTPNCTLSYCHGAAMQANLDLREGASYGMLVGVASEEVPDKLRVEAYDPDNSYLICKLENCDWIVGSQMPLVGGPLDQDVIDVIREWILLGAPETPSVSVDAASWGSVKALYRD
jgi:hypothetical protein